MKPVKKTFLIFLLLIVFVVIAGTSYLQYSKPEYEGDLTLKNISKETTVYFDDYGVPHIYANNQKDAMTTLGYMHKTVYGKWNSCDESLREDFRRFLEEPH